MKKPIYIGIGDLDYFLAFHFNMQVDPQRLFTLHSFVK